MTNVSDSSGAGSSIIDMINSGLPAMLIMHELRKKPLPILDKGGLDKYRHEPLVGLNIKSKPFDLDHAKLINVGREQYAVHCPMTMASAVLIDRLYTDHEIIGITGAKNFYRPIVRRDKKQGKMKCQNVYLGRGGIGEDRD